MVEREITVADHIKELKRRVLIVFYTFFAFSIIGFSLHAQIEHILQKPLGQTLYYSNPAGGLSFVMQVSLGFGFIAVLPLAIFHMLQFARPTFRPVRTGALIKFTLISVILAALALIYSYFISLPTALNFLVNFNTGTLQALINVNDYMRFILAYMIGAIIAFQLPIILYFTNKIKRFPPGGISKTQRPIIAGIVIVSGIITPTIDPINQLLLAGPMLALYEAGVVAIVLANRKVNRSVTREFAPFAPVSTPNIAPTASGNVIVPQLIRTQQNNSTVTNSQIASPRPKVYMDIINQQNLVNGAA